MVYEIGRSRESHDSLLGLGTLWSLGTAISLYFIREPDTLTRSPILQLGLDLRKTRIHHIIIS